MKNFCVVVTLILISALPAYAGKWTTGTTAPATCTVGDSWTDTNGTADNRFYTCTATNTWTLNSNQTAIDAKANKAGSVMLWSEWGDGASFTTSSPPVAYNGSLYKCTAPYTKVTGETPDTQTEYFAEVTGVGGGIAHATSDGSYYASRNGAWESLAGIFASPLGTDDNYVTDAEKVKLGNLSGANTGDQTATTTAFTPNGTIAATNTQAAIEEVRNEAGSATLPTATAGQILQADADGVYRSVSEIAGLINDAGTATDDLWSAAKNIAMLAGKQATLVSGTNIKTINSQAITGAGNVTISGTFGFDTYPTYEDSPHDSGIAVNGTTLAVYSATASKWLTVGLADTLDPAPVTYAATLTITDANATGNTFTLNSIAYDVADSPVSVTDLPTDTEVITYTGSNLGNCTGDVTGTANTGPWTITDGAAAVDCAVTVATAPSFSGAPGAIETFEAGAGSFVTSAFTETDPQSIIDTYSAAQFKDGSHSAYFGFTGGEANRNYIKADMGAPDANFSLTYWVRPTYPGGYGNNYSFSSFSDNATEPYFFGDNALTSSVKDLNGGTSYHLLIYGTTGHEGTVAIPYNTWIKLIYSYNSGGTSTVAVYNASDTLLETITVNDTQAVTPQYLYLGTVSSIISTSARPFYIDGIQYNSTNP